MTRGDWFMFCTLFLIQGCSTTKPIQWLDHATITEYDYKSHSWPSDIQFGLRDDGIVLWRKIED